MAKTRIKTKKSIIVKRGTPVVDSEGLLSTPVKRKARTVTVGNRRLKRIFGQ